MEFSSKDLSLVYSQLGTMIDAGVPIQNALATLCKTAPNSMRSTVAQLREIVGRGIPLHEAIASFPNHFPQLDRKTLGICEKSGSLDRGLSSLSDYYEKKASARKKILSASIFPVLLLFAGVFVSHLPDLVLGMLGQRPYTPGRFLFDTLGLLVFLSLGGGALCWLIQALFKIPHLNVRLDRAMRFVPVLGSFRSDYALSRWIESTRLMLNAGFGVMEALDHSSKMTSSPLILDAYERAKPMINNPSTVSQALESTNDFPPTLIQFWATGEQSGRMDEMLQKLSKYYEEKWGRSLDALAAWLPRLAYGIVAIFMAVQILKFGLAYVNTLNAVMDYPN